MQKPPKIKTAAGLLARRMCLLQLAGADLAGQTIRIVVPFTPGTGMDTIARAVCAQAGRAAGPAGGGAEHAGCQRQYRCRRRGQGQCRTATPC
jgi:hypothetical protein